MSYGDLRSEYSELGYHNGIVESIITYDSLMETYMNLYNVQNFTDDDNESQEDMFLQLGTIIQNEYSEVIPIKSIYDEHIEDSIRIVEPIGDLDLKALTNEKGIFIADTIVYKLFSNGKFLTFSISSFPMVCESEYEPLYEQVCMENDGLIPDLEYIYVYDYDYYRNEILTSSYDIPYYNEDNKYRMNVSLEANANYSRFYGTTTLSAEIKVKNYKLGCFGWFYWLTKQQTAGSYDFLYEAYTERHSHDIQNYYHIFLNDYCRKFSRRDIIARYADYYFPNPQCGFIYAHWNISNGYVTATH